MTMSKNKDRNTAGFRGRGPVRMRLSEDSDVFWLIQKCGFLAAFGGGWQSAPRGRRRAGAVASPTETPP